MKKNNLSFSALQKYQTCGYAYELHYKKKLRPNVTSASLLLGSALDTALNSLLTKDGKDPHVVFDEAWKVGFINKRRVELATSLQVVYAKSDLDEVLFTTEDYDALVEFCTTSRLSIHPEYKDGLRSCLDVVRKRKEQEKFINFLPEELQLFNYANWLCLSRKAHLIIDAYAKEVVPKIKRVIAVQKKIDFNNEEGDSIVGYIDLIAEWEDGKVYVLDNKSANRPYDDDAVQNSPQLALYANHENIFNAGFIVFLKQIKKEKTRVCKACGVVSDNNRIKTCNQTLAGKRCGGEFDEVVTPKAEIQILLNEVNQKLVSMVMENFETVNTLVNQGIFLKNFKSCTDHYGGYCPFYKLCYYGKDEGLEVVE